MPDMTRVVVGMSGGVDSSLAAVLLAEQGYEVVGVSMKLWPCDAGAGEDPDDACCSPSDARAIALQHGIAHYVVDFEAAFRERVVDGFVDAWRRGETPNPCVGCNERIKFGELWDWAQRIGAGTVGTGHYARTACIDGRWYPLCASDPSKDQSYFLFTLGQDQLAAAQFPLGELGKQAVRRQAAERGLHNADKDESMDLCFIGDDGIAGYLRRHAPEAFAAGPIELDDGTVLGEHRGLPGFTVGQRKGIGVAWTEALYVQRLEPARNALVLAPKQRCFVDAAVLRDCTWHAGALPAGGLRCRVRNRHRARPVPALIEAIELADGSPGARVRYQERVLRPSPGQACVAYDEELRICLGGGWFASEAEPARERSE